MKQTQTKMFDFSDVGLDFCFGSKSLFPDRFKKMLSEGYNLQTVSSVAKAGDKITLTYGINHNYKADRVLKINSGPLSAINNGEFWVESVTTNTVTITIENAPDTISGGFATKVAPLGWDLVFEQSFIHVYKMKHIDDTDRYVRLCFQSVLADRNAVVVCIGKTFDNTTGAITDPLALQSTASVTTASTINIPKWDSYNTTTAQNNWNYTNGYSTFGLGMAVGSKYHFAFINGDGYVDVAHHVYGIFPCHCMDYDALDYPVLLGLISSSASIYGNFSNNGSGHGSIGNIRVRFDCSPSASSSLIISGQPTSSFLSSNVDGFNTTTATPMMIFEQSTSQYLGQIYGLYLCMYNSSNMPSPSNKSYPSITTDIDLNSTIVVAASGSNSISSLNSARFLVLPVEEIKIV